MKKKLFHYIANSLSRARKIQKDRRENGYDLEEQGPQYYDGYIAALLNFRKVIKGK